MFETTHTVIRYLGDCQVDLSNQEIRLTNCPNPSSEIFVPPDHTVLSTVDSSREPSRSSMISAHDKSNNRDAG